MKKSIFLMFLKDNLKIFFSFIVSIGLIVWVIQSVGLLDFVTEDGHSLRVYFSYSLFSFPKIIHRILPFIFFVTLFYQLNRSEEKNELIIFWINGVTKIQFINVLLIYSVLFTLFQIFLGGFISPKGQDEARSFIRNSNLDFFSTIIKEEKFIDTVENLTIFVSKKDNFGNYINIFLKEDIKNLNKSQIIYAKKALLIENNKDRFFKFFDGKLIKIQNEESTTLDFKTIEFDLLKYSTKSTTFPKIQEVDNYTLFKCLSYVRKNKVAQFRADTLFSDKLICDKGNTVKNIKQELFKRFYLPIYLPLLTLTICLLIIKAKEDKNYNSFRFFLFFVAFLIIIISEISLRYSTNNQNTFLFFIIFPPLVFTTIYSLMINKLRGKN